MDFIQITIIDVIDIFVVASIMMYVYRITKGTHAPSIVLGIVLIYLSWLLVRAFNMELLSVILGQLIGVGTIALIVVFQPDIRRFLHVIGARSAESQSNLFGKLFDTNDYSNKEIEYVAPIVKACTDMAKSKTGALIVIKQKSDLSVIIETGIVVDSRISSSILKTIFFKNSPLHDGAVIVEQGRIVAAKCILPITETQLADNLGMRHRSAMGISEASDAIVVVVSEETGTISIVQRGNLMSNITPAELQNRLLKSVVPVPS